MLIGLFNFVPQSWSLIIGRKNTHKRHLRIIKNIYSAQSITVALEEISVTIGLYLYRW